MSRVHLTVLYIATWSIAPLIFPYMVKQAFNFLMVIWNLAMFNDLYVILCMQLNAGSCCTCAGWYAWVYQMPASVLASHVPAKRALPAEWSAARWDEVLGECYRHLKLSH